MAIQRQKMFNQSIKQKCDTGQTLKNTKSYIYVVIRLKCIGHWDTVRNSFEVGVTKAGPNTDV